MTTRPESPPEAEPPTEEQPFHSSGPLLERENLQTHHAQDARRLIRVFTELIEFKEERCGELTTP